MHPVTRLEWAMLFAAALFIILIDQISKAWVVDNFLLYETRVPIPFLRDVFDFTYTRNTGAAFGLFQSGGILFLIVAFVASAAIIYYYRQVPKGAWPVRIALGFMMGGALGNAIDRLTRGYVVDFLHVFYEPLGFDFPVFNVADSAIVIGVGIVLLMMWLFPEEEAESPVVVASDVPSQEQS